jgi:hypothetical protein
MVAEMLMSRFGGIRLGVLSLVLYSVGCPESPAFSPAWALRATLIGQRLEWCGGGNFKDIDSCIESSIKGRGAC